MLLFCNIFWPRVYINLNYDRVFAIVLLCLLYFFVNKMESSAGSTLQGMFKESITMTPSIFHAVERDVGPFPDFSPERAKMTAKPLIFASTQNH